MKVLVFQMKRIGDLVLTTPALTALKQLGARVTLVVDAPCGSLCPAIPNVDEVLVYSKKGSNRALWRRLRERDWDVCLDYTASDRSALMAWFSRTPRRITFAWARKRLLRRLAYHEFVESPVRLAHTCDHYLDLLRPLGVERGSATAPSLTLPDDTKKKTDDLLAAAGITFGYALIHPGTARVEKYWLTSRWMEVIARLREKKLAGVITSGPDAFERAHVAEIISEFAQPSINQPPVISIAPPDLLSFAALVERARIVVSCDTAAVHLAAAFQKPQIALFGPTNPFHWRPRHERAIVISAAQPESPLANFTPKMKGAPMEKIPTATVLKAVESLLAESK